MKIPFSDTSTGLTTPRVRARRSPSASLQKNSNNWRPWKRKESSNNSYEKLLIPLPIPHPVHIAIAIHNRDSEQPIPMDSEICWDILRAIEDCHGDVQVSLFFLIILEKYLDFKNSWAKKLKFLES